MLTAAFVRMGSNQTFAALRVQNPRPPLTLRRFRPLEDFREQRLAAKPRRTTGRFSCNHVWQPFRSVDRDLRRSKYAFVWNDAQPCPFGQRNVPTFDLQSVRAVIGTINVGGRDPEAIV